MKTLKHALLVVMMLASFSNIKAQCSTAIGAYASGATVQFYSGYYDTTNVLTSYSWDFGDGDTSQSIYATHTYAHSGTYTYCFHYSNGSCSADTCEQVTVNICDFNPQITYSGNYPDYTFSTYNVPVNATTYSWVIYDSTQNVLFTSNLQSPQFTFLGYGTNYSASVQVTLANGCTDSSQTSFYIANPCGAYFYYGQDTTDVAFYAYTYDSLGNSLYTYSWDFGDGSSASVQNPVHNFGSYGTWNICLTVNGQACSATTCQAIAISAPPPPPCPVNIYVSSTAATASFYSGTDSLNALTSYSWDFGDGDTSQSRNPVHVYAQSGFYTCCFTYTGTSCSGSICDSVTIDVCDFDPQITYSVNNLTASFAVVNPQAGAVYSWIIYSNDGSYTYPSSVAAPQVTLPGYGYYTAVVTVTLLSGCTDSSVAWLNIANPCEAHFGYYPTANTELGFYGQPYDSLNVNQFTYTWNFGDGSTSSLQSPTHNFGNYGTWNVCFSVTSLLCADTICQIVTVSPPPPPTYNISGNISKGANGACNVVVYLIQDSAGYLWIADTRYIYDTIGSCTGAYSFSNLIQGTYHVKAALTSSDADYANYLPTYYGDVLDWSSATAVNLNSNQNNININLIAGINPGGPGFIGGWVSQGAGLTIGGSNNGRGVGDPLSNIQINLLTDNDVPVASAITNADGRYTFSNLALGTYKVYAEEINKVPYPLNVTLSANNPSQDNVNVSVNSNTAVTGLDDLREIRIEGVFPNPVTDKTVIAISLKQNSKLQMSLTDVDGRILQNKFLNLTSGANQIQLDLSNQASGVYHLSLINDASKKIIRLVKVM